MRNYSASTGITTARDTRRVYVRLFAEHLMAQLDLISRLSETGKLEACCIFDLVAAIDDSATALGHDDADLTDPVRQSADAILTSLGSVRP